jgi:aminomethyltransferase
MAPDPGSDGVPSTATTATATLRRSPLHERHVAAGARFAAFGGWEMPLEYAGGGVLAEHRAVREGVGIFDVSHLGKATVAGTGALELADATFTNALDRIPDGHAQYTLCCDARGGVVDDLIVYRRSDTELFLVPNAANTDSVVTVLAAAAPRSVTVTNLHPDFAVLAVQGPDSDRLLTAAGLPAGHPYMSFVDARHPAARSVLTVCRTGYTGERGYEIVTAAADAGAVWDALLAAGAEPGVRPCGLGARDTLRTEMGYALHGQDIGPDTSPVQARLAWAVGWDKPAFAGRAALVAERAAAGGRRLWGVRAAGRAIPRPGMTVTDGAGSAVGTVTSGTFSPTLRSGIGLALLDRPLGPGADVAVVVRGRAEPFAVVRPPFVDRRPA